MELNWPLRVNKRSTKRITLCHYHENATSSRAQQKNEPGVAFSPAATDRADARGLSLAKSISDVDGRAFPVDRDFVSSLSTLFFCPVLFSAELNPGTART